MGPVPMKAAMKAMKAKKKGADAAPMKAMKAMKAAMKAMKAKKKGADAAPMKAMKAMKVAAAMKAMKAKKKGAGACCDFCEQALEQTSPSLVNVPAVALMSLI